MKRCSKCKKMKVVTAFNKKSRMKDGLDSICRDCLNARIRRHRKNPEVNKRLEVVHRKNREVDPRRLWAFHTRAKHQRKFKVQVTNPELTALAKTMDSCPICDVKFVWPHGGLRNPKSPSWDRINNGKIMTLKNTQIICIRCNMTKSDRTMKEFIAYCQMVVDKFGEENE